MSIKTILFEDHGQDFLEWDINELGEVVDSRPYQGWIWSGCMVLNLKELLAGDRISVDIETPRGFRTVNYPIKSVGAKA